MPSNSAVLVAVQVAVLVALYRLLSFLWLSRLFTPNTAFLVADLVALHCLPFFLWFIMPSETAVLVVVLVALYCLLSF